ncbi:PD-(D/E)XK nuclease-like domain-containing protein [bacterium]|nr:PD-(D/E)XK nuclease-like domain-containing protein [bacterium]
MNKKQILSKLKIDEEYYGKFGNQFLSNSHVGKLLKDPLNAFAPSKPSPAFLVGGYFHTCILEPDKLEKYKVVKATTRNTKAYKDVAGGELCLLEHEVDMIELMRQKVMDNDICRDLIKLGNVEYEVPMITELFNNKWKGKADIVNHDEKLIIDLKTTADIDKFQWSASKYNYDSQAYIYSKLFGYEFLFIVIDKNTHQIGMFDCSPQFYERGEDKVRKASEAYDLFYKAKDFDPKQYFISKTL